MRYYPFYWNGITTVAANIVLFIMKTSKRAKSVYKSSVASDKDKQQRATLRGLFEFNFILSATCTLAVRQDPKKNRRVFSKNGTQYYV